MKYLKWTPQLEAQAKFLLLAYKNYDVVAGKLGITRSALKVRNNKHWNINCKNVWDTYTLQALKDFLEKGFSKKKISSFFHTTENAISIQLSKMKEK